MNPVRTHEAGMAARGVECGISMRPGYTQASLKFHAADKISTQMHEVGIKVWSIECIFERLNSGSKGHSGVENCGPGENIIEISRD
jgi:hypothetical protein